MHLDEEEPSPELEVAFACSKQEVQAKDRYSHGAKCREPLIKPLRFVRSRRKARKTEHGNYQAQRTLTAKYVLRKLFNGTTVTM